MNFAEKMHARIELFHVTPRRMEPVLQSGSYLLGGGWVGAPERVTTEDTETSALLRQWANRGVERGLEVNILQESRRANISELILQTATEIGCDWIAMAAESGTIRAWALGSITRQVVRAAPCPVWILRPTSLGH